MGAPGLQYSIHPVWNLILHLYCREERLSLSETYVDGGGHFLFAAATFVDGASGGSSVLVLASAGDAYVVFTGETTVSGVVAGKNHVSLPAKIDL